MAAHVHGKVYEYLKLHAGQTFTASNIHEALGVGSKEDGASLCNTMRVIKKKHPSVIEIVKLGKRLLAIKYKGGNSGEPARPIAPKQTTEVDVLVTIPLGDNQTAVLTVPQAQRVHQQLKALFG